MTLHFNTRDIGALKSIAGLLSQQRRLCETAARVANNATVKQAVVDWRRESREMLRQVEAELDNGAQGQIREIDFLIAADTASMRMRAALRGADRVALGALMRGRSRLRHALGRRMSDMTLGRKTRAFLTRLAMPPVSED